MEEKDEKPINVPAIISMIWAHRKTYYKVLPAALIGTYLFMLFIPRYYKCEVSLAPEPTGASMPGSLSSMAASIGLGSMSKLGNTDALNIDIYPDIMASKDFIAELMTVPVENQDGDFKTSYYVYLRDHQKAPWWDCIKGAIIEFFDPMPQDGYQGEERIDVFHLNKRQAYIFQDVQGKIKCNIDKKTDIASVIVKDQDPLICATMANATCKKLQEFIVKYRTNKARIDYEYYKKLTAEAKREYEKIRQQYVNFADANQDVLLARYRAKEEDLENEMQLKYNVYTAMNSQMQAAEAKLQEATPAFTVIESASIPVKPAGPRRMIISIFMMMMAFFVLTGRLLMKK